MEETSGQPVLEVRDLGKRFGGRVALRDVSFSVAAGEVVGVVGPNGAGKSTLLSVVSGLLGASSGSVRLHGREITALPAATRVHLGICKTNQQARCFRSLSVLDNLRVARPRHWPERSQGGFDSFAAEVLRRLGLERHLDARAGSLSVGQQKLLDLGRVLARRPGLLLADEPTAGVSPARCEVIVRAMKAAAAEGAGVVFVSHDIAVLRSCSSRLLAMSAGQIVTTGDVDSVLRDPGVVAAYLGRPA